MHRRCGLALLSLLLATPSWAADEGPADILMLFDQFVSAGAAASRCASPSDYVAVRFLSNFQWVSMHATRELSRRSPEFSNDDVARELARRSQLVKDETHALVLKRGCESDSVRELIERFVVQSAWKPGTT